MEVKLTGPLTVRFEPRSANAFRVTVEDSDGFLAQAGFQTGDLWIGIGDQEFENEMQMQGLMQMSLAKETVDLIVLRGGRRITLPANLKVWFESRGEIGGEIDPVAR